MSLLKKEINEDTYYFTYENVAHSQIPSEDDIAKLWTSRPYETNKNSSSYMHALTKEELKCFPGLKQHVITSKLEEIKDQDHADYESISTRNEIAQKSYHRMSINSSITTKTGKGAKIFEDGCNACINAMVTRFDEHGNLQIMAMKRPENSTSDAGEYQMSAGCLYFGGNGHTVTVDGKNYTIKGSVKHNLVEGAERLDHTGKVQGVAKAHAIAAILEKLWTDENSKKIIESFDFNLLFKSIVDDTSNTRHRWVETSYVIHHITGDEDIAVLEHLKDSKVDTKRENVGHGVWRSIEMKPKGKVYSQVVIKEDKKDKSLASDDSIKTFRKVMVEHDESSRAFDPATEFEFWHGDHSVVAARIYEYVTSNYHFLGKGEVGFGLSKPVIVKPCSLKWKNYQD